MNIYFAGVVLIACHAVHATEPSAKALAEARAEDAQYQEQARKHAELKDKLQENKKAMRIILSAAICILKDYRKSLTDEIATENKYGRIGGAANMTKRYAIQKRLRTTDEKIAEVRDGLNKAMPYPCSHGAVTATRACMADDAPDECRKDPFLAMTETVSADIELEDE